MGWLGDFFEWLGDLYDRAWPISRWPPEDQPDWFRQGFPVITLLLAGLLILFILAASWRTTGRRARSGRWWT